MGWFERLRDFLLELEKGFTESTYDPTDPNNRVISPVAPQKPSMLTNPSPNFTKGRKGIIGVVVHRADASFASLDSWFQNPTSQVSAHYGIGLDGTEHSYVHESDTAWHAGAVKNPSWKLYNGQNPNAWMLGIETEGHCTDTSWPFPQQHALARRIAAMAQAYGFPIDADHVIPHSAIDSVTRAYCPSTNPALLPQVIALATILDQTDKNTAAK